MCAAASTLKPSRTTLHPAVMTYYASTLSSAPEEYLPIAETVNSGDRPHSLEGDQPLGLAHPTATAERLSMSEEKTLEADEAPVAEDALMSQVSSDVPSSHVSPKVLFRPELLSPFGSLLF